MNQRGVQKVVKQWDTSEDDEKLGDLAQRTIRQRDEHNPRPDGHQIVKQRRGILRAVKKREEREKPALL